MKIKRCLLLSLIVVSTIALTSLGFYFRDSLYSDYWSEIKTRPILSMVFSAALDDVFPWSDASNVLKEGALVEDDDTVNNSQDSEQDFDGIAFSTVDDSYFNDALFIGDSRMVGLSEYCEDIYSRATFYAKKSLTIYDIIDEDWIKTDDGKKLTLWEALEGQQFSKIYIMVGINEIGTGDEIRFRNAYEQVLEKLSACQPKAIIFINSIMHVSGEKNENDALYNNTNIEIRNEAIKTLADDVTYFYLDVNEAVDDDEGNLNGEWTSDGVHLKAAYYEYWHQYLLEHGIVV